jgi:hypothetical protein
LNWFFALCFLLCGCSATSPWRIDSIAAGEARFNSSRLRYASSQRHPPLVFEMLKIGDEVQAFLSLTKFRLSPHCTKLILTIRGEVHEEAITPHEGLMRVRLGNAITSRLIQALQRGDQVSILIDGFEENLDPSQFSPSFSQFLGVGSVFSNFIQGPLP